MEVTFWQYLWREGGLHLKQKLPDVALFRGSKLEAWVFTNGKGLVQRRLENSSVQEFLKHIMSSAVKRLGAGTVGPFTPVAILRKISSSFLEASGPMKASPVAIVLTASELTALVQRLAAGYEEADVFSLQAIVEPHEDCRIVSVYSCDALGEERSDVFGRRFHKVYPIHVEDVEIPSPDEVAADRCIPLPPATTGDVEARTLSIVRYLKRFYNIALDGLIAEFLMDQQGHVVLHGVWNMSTFHPSAPHADPKDPIDRRDVPPPATHPMPVVTSSSLHEAHSSLRTQRDPGREWADIEARGLEGALRHQDSHDYLDADAGDATGGHGRGREDFDYDVVASYVAPRVLLEVWAGDDFLGETWLPDLDNVATSLRPTKAAMPLLPLHLNDGSRPDSRKGPGTSHQITGAIHGDVMWVPPKEGAAELKGQLLFWLRHGEDLTRPGGATRTCNPRILLWICTSAPGLPPDFAPLWGSAEVQDSGNPWFNEQIELQLPMVRVPARPKPPAEPKKGGHPTPRKSSRPSSARPRAGTDDGEPGTPKVRSRPNSVAPGGKQSVEFDEGGTRRSRSRSPGASRGRTPSREKQPLAVARSVKKPTHSVAGAEMNSHWGMARDGTASTTVLTNQVVSRLSTEKTNRSQLLSILARQLERYRDMQSAWLKQKEAAKILVERAESNLKAKDERLAEAARERERLIEQHKKRLAAMYRGMCAELDTIRAEKIDVENRLAESLQRESEQQSMIKKLEARNAALRQTLEKTMAKLNETQGTYTVVQAGGGDIQGLTATYAEQTPELSRAMSRIQTLASSRDLLDKELATSKASMLRMQDDLNRERAHSLRLQNFLRKIAMGPSSALRIGGGYLMDKKCKEEALGLLREAAVISGAVEHSQFHGHDWG